MFDIFTARALIAVVAAGVVGTLVNTVAVALVVSPDRLALALVPGRYAVAIAPCLALPLLARKVGGPGFFAIGALWLTVAASVLAKFVFGVGALWGMVLGFNLVYAIAAIAAYHVIAVKLAK